jgi:DNA-binding NarL/FixJ family response regulator
MYFLARNHDIAGISDLAYIALTAWRKNNKGVRMLKVLVVEDHALVREGLAQLVKQLDADVRVFEASDGDKASAVLASEPHLDLVMLDLALPGTDGLSWLGTQRKVNPTVPVVVISAYDDSQTVKRVLKAGASGFVPKAYPGDRLLDALRRVLNGEIVEPDNLRTVAVGTEAPTAPQITAKAKDFGLSGRQAEVLALMAKGKSNRDIAAAMGLTEGTVKIHVTAVFKALGVGSRTQALLAVARHKIKL